MQSSDVAELLEAARRDSKIVLEGKKEAEVKPKEIPVPLQDLLAKTAELRTLLLQCAANPTLSMEDQTKLAEYNKKQSLSMAKIFTAMDILIGE